MKEMRNANEEMRNVVPHHSLLPNLTACLHSSNFLLLFLLLLLIY